MTSRSIAADRLATCYKCGVALQKAFHALSDSLTRAKRKLQIIVLDHAAETVWGKIAGVNPVEDWRNGKKLVPQDWFT